MDMSSSLDGTQSEDATAVRVVEGADGPVLVLRGRVDVSEARVLHEVALALAPCSSGVTVDCADVERLDAAAVQVLLALRTRLVAAGATLRCAHVLPTVEAILRLAGVREALIGEERP